MNRDDAMVSAPTSLRSATRRAARILSGLGLGAMLTTGTAACLIGGEERGALPEPDEEPTECHQEVSAENFAQAMASRDDYVREAQKRVSPAQPPMVTQPVVFHVLHKADGTGKVAKEALVKQVAQLNAAFSGGEADGKGYAKATDARIRFTFHSAEYVENDDYHDLCALWTWQDKIKKQLAVDPAKYLNVYVCHVGALGLAWLPYQAYKSPWTKQIWDPLPENHYYHGPLLDWELVPGSTVKGGRWSQGDILTHEVGHHYGLKHIYEGGCYGTEEISDGIDDTPRQEGNPSRTCQAAKGTDSCPHKPGKDDNANYMGINFDTCRSHFTPGQVDFMRATIAKYKPTLAQQSGG